MLYAVVLAGFIFAVCLYANFTVKGPLEDLEHKMGLTKFSASNRFTDVTVSGSYKSDFITIQGFVNFLLWKRDNYHVIYTVKHRSPFNAEITPGAGLTINEKKERERLKKEEAATKVWNPNLTDEERRIIEDRKKTRGDVEEDGAEQASDLKIISTRQADVQHYLDEDGRRELVISLFKKGVSMVKISVADVAIDLPHGRVEDMEPSQIEAYVKDLRRLIVQRIE